MNALKFVLVLLAALSFSACQQMLYIAAQQADCTGAADQKCYLIRKSPEDNWILHYQDFEGLDYTMGYQYKVKVKRQRIKDPPTDGSEYRYVVLEVLNKEKKLSSDLILGARTWQLESYGSKAHPGKLAGDADISLQFNTEETKINGSSGCNRYFSAYVVEGETLKFGMIGSTRMACEEELMSQETEYLSLLQSVERFELDDNHLTLFTNEEEVLNYKGQ